MLRVAHEQNRSIEIWSKPQPPPDVKYSVLLSRESTSENHLLLILESIICDDQETLQLKQRKKVN